MNLEQLDVAVLDQSKLPLIDELIASYPDPAGKIMMILTKCQEVYGYLPPPLQLYIARKIGVPAAKINGIVSFYALFSEEPEAKFNIAVCLGTACFVKGAGEILEACRQELGLSKDQHMTDDGLFSLSEVRCIGACGLAPVMRINEKIFGRVSPAEIPQIINSYREAAHAEGGDK
ncbi:MAG: NAD(P)H-dependent oxidoreductase subunit E [Eubacteriales bacterium]|nr:NAD(P)H-dependent oxidoreductase subunit E [Eubacteriales bacterium]